MKNIFIYIYIFICRLSVISEKVTEEREKKFQKNNIEIIRDRKWGRKIKYDNSVKISKYFNLF